MAFTKDLESGGILERTASTRRKRVRWDTLLDGIASGDQSAGATLYRELMPIRCFFATRLSEADCEDRYHDVIVAVLRAIRIGRMRDAESIPAYAWATAQRIRKVRLEVIIAQRQATADVDSETLSDAGPDPESIAIREQNKQVAIRVLANLPARHREVLIRYYLKGQSPAEIQAELGITATQFRLAKSRAKAALTAKLQHKLDRGQRKA